MNITKLNNNSKILEHLSTYALVYIIAIVFLGFMAFCFFGTTGGSGEGSPADGYTIENFDLDLKVSEDNVVKVIENINLNWNETGHHGIYRFIPQWLEYTSKDKKGNLKTIKRKSIIKNLRVEDENYELDTINKKKRIKIGSANETLPIGDKKYTIKYDYNMGADPYDGYDEFIFHAFGDFWGTPIKNPTVRIEMPSDDFDESDIKLYMDKYQEQEITEVADIQVNDSTVLISLDEIALSEYLHKTKCSKLFDDENCDYYTDEHLNGALTIDIRLDEGYFKGGTYNYGFASLIAALTCIALTIISFIIWWKYGKDYPKVTKTVEFYPPEGYDAAEVGYIYHRQSSKKLTIATIISLARKGYLKIDETDDKKIQITNLYPTYEKPSLNKEASKYKRSVEVTKLKDYDNTLTKDERVLMKYLFKNNNYRILSSNFQKFDNSKDGLIKKGYIEVVHDNADEVEKKINELDSNYYKRVDEYEKNNSAREKKLGKAPELSELEKTVYEEIISYKDEFILSENTKFYKVFDKVESHLQYINSTIRENKEYRAVNWLFAVICIALGILSFFVFQDASPRLYYVYKIPVFCIPIILFFSIWMERKTKEGEKLTAQVKGFREFLRTAEKKQLEALVEKNPNYFYDILPFTYVLGLSKKWIEKFEDIPVPKVDMGTYDFNAFNSFNNFYNDVEKPHYSSSGGHSSGCSSCGGGCSSCGGGCSSCGGGSSW